jgi:hypothetical protein
MSAFLDKILGRSTTKAQIAAWAKDAKPEDVATAMDALVEEVEKKKKESAEDAHPADCDCSTCKGAKDSAAAADKKAMDRKRFHDALDRTLDGKEEEMNAADADMEELKAMFGGKGGKDETVAGEQNGKEMPENGGIDEGVEALTIEPEDRPKSAGAGTDHAAYKAGGIAVLKALKPSIAASGNKSLIGAYDTAAKIVAGSKPGGTAGKGGYGAVATAAASVGRDAAAQKTRQEAAAAATKEIDDMYAARRNGRN